jgi:hypothetical protein
VKMGLNSLLEFVIFPCEPCICVAYCYRYNHIAMSGEQYAGSTYDLTNVLP